MGQSQSSSPSTSGPPSPSKKTIGGEGELRPQPSLLSPASSSSISSESGKGRVTIPLQKEISTALKDEDRPPMRLQRTSSKNDKDSGSSAISKDFRERLSVRRKVSEFDEEYTKIRELGSGITGQVWLVRNKRGDERAMKTINLSRVNRAQLRELRTEVTLLKSLDHPNVVRLLEVFEDANNVMLIMDHCKGGSLASPTGRQRLRTEREVASVIYQLFLAIKYVHDNKIVHRDIKLENILFVSEEKTSLHVQLIDFGLSGIQRNSPWWSLNRDKKRLFATTCGTTFYMAPEVVDGKYDSRCDIWSLGVLTFLLLTGKPPFHGSDEKSTIYKIKNAEPDFSAPIWAKLNPSAQDLVRHLLVKDPAKRWTAEAALESQWFDRYRQEIDKQASGAELEGDIVQSLTKFVSYGKMKKMALLVIAHHFPNLSALAEVKNLFLSLDKDKSGEITFNELRTLLQKHNFSEEEMTALFESIDVDDSGSIQLTEFLAATMEAVCRIDQEKMIDAFDHIAQGEDYITINHLSKLLGKMDRKQFKEMISSIDDNGDGKISREEFLQLIDAKQESQVEEIVGDDQRFSSAVGM